jgi:hypothetical protein
VKAHYFNRNVFAPNFQEFWRHWHGNVIDKKMMCEHGVMVTDQFNDRMRILAMGYLYPIIGADICYMGFVVRNPEVSAFRAGKALKLLISKAEDTARGMGYSILHTTFEVESLRKYVAKQGYVACAETQIFIKDLR